MALNMCTWTGLSLTTWNRARTGLALALSSFGSLGAAPVQGALLTHDFHWIRPIAFSAVRYDLCWVRWSSQLTRALLVIHVCCGDNLWDNENAPSQKTWPPESVVQDDEYPCKSLARKYHLLKPD